MDNVTYLPAVPAHQGHADSETYPEPTIRQRLALIPDPDADVPEQAISEIEAVRVRRQVAALPRLHRIVIASRFGIYGPLLTRRQLADRLKLTPSAIRRIEAEGLQLLRGVTLAPREAA